ncbi:alpha-lytic protease prodomain-containing protein [Asanoa iriomotensis]|uniref:Trypsin n=1 Tax=Asanoa iriomotensis TaxID=234613 RepID=A0ABQ4BZ02_9ACTN|nr:alpha-lytic protease prodomain-containing protein [Asanoa iriomotensis]GIF55285.1 hypothetical protein Air01nite_13800 [Asanoa iriomotensis]
MYRRKRHGAWLARASAAACLLVLATGFTAPREPDPSGITVAADPSAADVSAEMRAALRRDLKLTDQQVTERLIRADWAARLDPKLRGRLGEAYAGSWIADNGTDFVVAVTDRKMESVVRASGATPKLVRRNAAELARIGDRLGKRSGVPKSLVGWVTDPTTNQVRLRHEPGGRATAEAFAAAAGVSGDGVGFEVTAQRPKPLFDTEAGDLVGFTTGAPPGRGPDGQLNYVACTTGFGVVHRPFTAQARSGFLTAGHCVIDGGTVAWGKPFANLPIAFPLGEAVDLRFNGENDAALVTTTPLFNPVARVNGHRRADIPVRDGIEQPGGSPVCVSGYTSRRLQCGHIRQGTYTFPEGIPRVGLRGTDTCQMPGDSGGPVISGNHAQGLVSLGYCGAFESGTFYPPLENALRMNTLLKTTPAPVTPPAATPSTKWTEGTQVWSGDVGGTALGQVSAVALGPDRLHAFARGTNNNLYTNVQTNGVWATEWLNLGGGLTDPPTVVTRAGGIDVFYRGSDTRPYFRRFNGSSWEPAVKLGDVDVEGGIAAAVYQENWVILFIRSSDDEVKYNFFDGQQQRWSGWLGLGGDVSDAPTAIMRPNAAGQPVLEVYARWADDNVRYRRLDPAGPPGWQPWTNLGGIWKRTPVPVTVGTDDSFLLGWARDDTLHFQRWRGGTWLRGPDGSSNTGWRGIGGQLAANPTAVAGPGNQIRVFARDASQRVNMAAWTGNDIYWENWVPLDGDTTAPLGASLRTFQGNGVIDVLGVDAATQRVFQTSVDVLGPQPTIEAGEERFDVGEEAAFTVTGPPGAELSWSSTRDGVVVEDHVSAGQHLDGSGVFTWYAGELPGSAIGSWVRQAHVVTPAGTTTTQVAYTVGARPVTVDVSRKQFAVGETVSFAVTGPPNQPILWSSTVNGASSGESNAFYGQHTDANGMFLTAVPWTDGRAGTWVKSVSVGGRTAQISFDVTAPTPPPPPPMPRVGPLATATGGDGRTYVVALAEDRRFLVREQQGSGSTDWYALGTPTFAHPPTAVTNSRGGVEVYGVGTDGAVYRNAVAGAGPGGWSGWTTAGPCCIVSRLSAVVDRFGRVNVFGLGTDNAVYVNRETAAGSGAWTGWTSMGTYLTSAPAAVRNSDGYLVVFAAGSDRNVFAKEIIDIGPDTRQYSAWKALGGGPVVGELTAAGPVPTVFVRRPDNLVYATHAQGASFRPWISVGGGALVSDPVAVSGPGSTTPLVMAMGTDQRLYVNRLTCYGGGWQCFETLYSGWQPTGAETFGAPAALGYLPDGRLRAAAIAADRRVFSNTQTAGNTTSFGGWSPF